MYETSIASSVLGIILPAASVPQANYVPWVVSQKLVFVAGQIPLIEGKAQFVGKLGREISVEQGQQAARLCALNILSHLRNACGGDLDKVARCAKVGAFVNCVPEFGDQPAVVNGASDLIVPYFGGRKEQRPRPPGRGGVRRAACALPRSRVPGSRSGLP